VLQKPSSIEKPFSWHENSKIKGYAAWGKNPVAAMLGKFTGIVMGSPAGPLVSKVRRMAQRFTAPGA
jgi:hypothetical protein